MRGEPMEVATASPGDILGLMRAGWLGIALLTSMLGCGASAEHAPPRTASPTPLTDTWVSAPHETARAPSSRTLAPIAQQGTILIGDPAPPPAPSRPRSRGKVEVSFHRADLENTLRFLADTGRFNLVCESGLTGSVTAQLRGVDAFDALVTIAEANGASVRYERGIVMVRKASAVARVDVPSR